MRISVHIPLPGAAHAISVVLHSFGKRGRGRGGRGRLERDGVPVEPNRPDTLLGGAAAPLEFDD